MRLTYKELTRMWTALGNTAAEFEAEGECELAVLHDELADRLMEYLLPRFDHTFTLEDNGE